MLVYTCMFVGQASLKDEWNPTVPWLVRYSWVLTFQHLWVPPIFMLAWIWAIWLQSWLS